jgi:hypothetical protein
MHVWHFTIRISWFLTVRMVGNTLMKLKWLRWFMIDRTSFYPVHRRVLVQTGIEKLLLLMVLSLRQRDLDFGRLQVIIIMVVLVYYVFYPSIRELILIVILELLLDGFLLIFQYVQFILIISILRVRSCPGLAIWHLLRLIWIRIIVRVTSQFARVWRSTTTQSSIVLVQICNLIPGTKR